MQLIIFICVNTFNASVWQVYLCCRWPSMNDYTSYL